MGNVQEKQFIDKEALKDGISSYSDPEAIIQGPSCWDHAKQRKMMGY